MIKIIFFKNLFILFKILDHFDRLMLKLFFKNKKNIILKYFKIKQYKPQLLFNYETPKKFKPYALQLFPCQYIYIYKIQICIVKKKKFKF
jgi:hypothetical protein